MCFVFFNDTATTEIYTLSLHDALPISEVKVVLHYDVPGGRLGRAVAKLFGEDPVQQVRDDLRRFKQVIETGDLVRRSEEHTSELQSRQYLVCRLLLEKKNRRDIYVDDT